MSYNERERGFKDQNDFQENASPSLKKEAENLYVGVKNFSAAFFNDVPYLSFTSNAVFQKCKEGTNPLFGANGWTEWPEGGSDTDLTAWLTELVAKLEGLVDPASVPEGRQRRLVVPPGQKKGSPGRHEKAGTDVGFVNGGSTTYKWSEILVPGEVNNDPDTDTLWNAWASIARFSEQVLHNADTRRFILSFTLCGSRLRLWEFDRCGGIASEQFDINNNGGALQLVTMILGFLRMNKKDLGFDPTVITSENGERYFEIEKDGQKKELIIDETLSRVRAISGRVTTCWRVHLREEPDKPLVVKDSWQLEHKGDEGLISREITERGVINVVRHYHHEAVHVDNEVDDVLVNIRKGLDFLKANEARAGEILQRSKTTTSSVVVEGGDTSVAVIKPDGESNDTKRPAKRQCLTESDQPNDPWYNRIHQRVIMRDFGKPIYTATSRTALLSALERCIEGHKAMCRAGYLHRDISINNLMINEDLSNPSYPAFLIDFDFTVRLPLESDLTSSVAGTGPFVSISLLCQDQEHTFMHDLESFFWVLFWICTCYGEGGTRVKTSLMDQWKSWDDYQISAAKFDIIFEEKDFLEIVEEGFTEYHQATIPCINELRKLVFPDGQTWKVDDTCLHDNMRSVLLEAISAEMSEDPEAMQIAVRQ